jgi:hypothetical protein
MIIRAYGHSTTETLVATPWKGFLATLGFFSAVSAGELRGASIKHKYNIFPICAHAPLRASSAP